MSHSTHSQDIVLWRFENQMICWMQSSSLPLISTPLAASGFLAKQVRQFSRSLCWSCVFNVSTFTSTSLFISSLYSDRFFMVVHDFSHSDSCASLPLNWKLHGIACFISLDTFIITLQMQLLMHHFLRLDWFHLLLWYGFCSSPRFTPTWFIYSCRLHMKLLLKMHPRMIPW